MTDDIVSRLREDFCDFGQWENSCTPEGRCPCCLAADEIERLRDKVEVLTKALRLVCDDISDFQVNDQMTFDEHISQVMNEYIEEASRG